MKWEYCSYEIYGDGMRPDLDGMNAHGVDGWELVTIIETTFNRYPIAYFKRPLEVSNVPDPE